MSITYRSVKGSKLTSEEVDGNFEHLETAKLAKALLEGGCRILVQVDAESEPIGLELAEGQLVGRMPGEDVVRAIDLEELGVVGFTPENASNKTTDGTLATNSDTKYPSEKAVRTYVGAQVGNEETARINGDASILASAQAYADNLVVGLWDDRGNFDASAGAYPSTGGSGVAGAIKKGDIWTISVAGTLPTGQIVEIGDTVRAKVDTPGNTQANWAIQQNNIGYTAENQANKDSSGGYVGLSGWSIKFRNLANTFTSLLQNAATAARTYTFPDYDGTIATQAGVETLTNKRVNPRVQAVASSATVTPSADNDDLVVVTAQAANLTIANPSGTPVNGQALMIRVKDNGSARTITFGAQYRAVGAALPTTTTIGKTMYIGCIYNSADTKWDVFPAQAEV